MVATPSRWLIVTQYYPPEVGAPQIRLSSLARQLKEQGCQVEILTAMPNYPSGKVFSDYKRKLYVREVIDGIPVRRVWIFAGTGKSPVIRLANYLSFTMTALIAALFGRRPDVIFLESQPLSLGIVGLLMHWLRRVPYIYNIPDLQIDVAKQMGFIRNARFLRMAEQLENLFMNQSYSVSTVTHHFIDHFVERGIPRDQLSFLPNGADADFLRPMPADQALLDCWGIGDRKVILYVGTHAYYHGLETLIEAARLLQHRSDLVFLLVGDGPERERLRQLAADYGLTNVIFGASPYGEMARLYSISYCSVATLRNIAVAKQMRLSKIFPSFSCAVPVIYSGIGEAAEILETEALGLVVAPEQPALLADSIAYLVDHPEERERFGQNGRRFIEANYSWSTITKRWLNEIYPERSPQPTA